MHKINRIIVDEAHQLLVSSDFRCNLRAIANLAPLNIPKIYLTATLPPVHEEEFFKKIEVPRKYVKMIRATTNRLELSYQLHNPFPGQDIVQAAAAIAKEITYKFFRPDSRGIIFTSSKATCDSIQRSLRTSICHSDILRPEVEQEAWREGKSYGAKWMAATSSFIHGIDYPTVDCIIFVGLPYGLIDFVQASARGGRTGRTCLVIVLHSSGFEAPECKEDFKLTKAMNQWASTSITCRRQFISKTLDGVTAMIRCARLPNAVKCDVCSSQQLSVVVVKGVLYENKFIHQSLDNFMATKSLTPRPFSYTVDADAPEASQYAVSPSLGNSDYGISNSALMDVDMELPNQNRFQSKCSFISLKSN